eukprot:TRINITY_DN74098_c0_g1_i1.p1 TRINITY_DN74098_c0_g1~~TRINITY_DN74098_c0_g1_i1.p1  ORF type:complete len:970 (+),score=125.07 TRINITY_DN74098_c0_g1_i1:58-2967(+)
MARRNAGTVERPLQTRIPLWAQRTKSEIMDARRLSIELGMGLRGTHESSVVGQMVQFALRNCLTARSATTFFYVLREASKNNENFTLEEVDHAEDLCLASLTGQVPRRPARPLGGGSSDEEAGSDDNDLSGEEAVDREHDVKITPELLADLGVELTDEERAEIDAYPAHLWEAEQPGVNQGELGFNSRATAVMRKARVGTRVLGEVGNSGSCPSLQPHQEIVTFLAHPRSPVSRLLIDHPTGSGKTREMINILDNYFYDGRAKIPIFPKSVVCRNFYMELIRWPNRYRDYFCCERPADAALASGVANWKDVRHHLWDLTRLQEEEVRHLCRSCRAVLEMKGQSFRGMMRKSFRVAFKLKHPGEPMPLAPLRAISYASAGGGYSKVLGGQPISAVMKIGWDASCQNVYSNKVVLMDEAHNLVRTDTKYVEQLGRLRELLSSAQRHVLAGFTGTPILGEAQEGSDLLRIIKGTQPGCCDEGYVSSLQCRPRPLFATPRPAGIFDSILTVQSQKQVVTYIELAGQSLNAYDIKRQKGIVGKRLRSYCNVSSFVSSFHDGVRGSKGKILAAPQECCPKLLAVAKAVAASSEKALVMTSRSCGYNVVLELLRIHGAEAKPPFRVATLDDLSSFNHVSNLRGEVFRVLVADAAQCSEGLSFLAVRRAFLTDVPESHSQLVQMCGRALRMFGHRGLSKNEQDVTYHLYVACLPKWMRSSLAAWAFRAQARSSSGICADVTAKILLGKLKKLGITSLTQLKERLQSLAVVPSELASEGAQPKPHLPTERVTEFILQHNLIDTDTSHKPENTTEKNGGDDVMQRRGPLVQAIQALACAPENCEVQLGFTTETADEVALRDLARQSFELAPALAKMRAQAVDAELVKNFINGGTVRRRLHGKTSCHNGKPCETRATTEPSEACSLAIVSVETSSVSCAEKLAASQSMASDSRIASSSASPSTAQGSVRGAGVRKKARRN